MRVLISVLAICLILVLFGEGAAARSVWSVFLTIIKWALIIGLGALVVSVMSNSNRK